jgi:hypothetical protein
MDTLAGTTCELRFLGAKTVTINGGTSQWSDQANYAIDRDKSYVVSFLVDHAASMGNAWHWTDSTNVSVRSTYIIPASSVPGEADLLSDVWSTRTDVVETNAVLGVQYLYSTYPTNGFYESAVIDTRLAAPVYSDIDWHESVPVGTDIRMKVRSGSSNDLSDAAAWTNIASMASPGSISPGNGRYVQFQCELTPNTYGTVTPKVKDVTLRWGGAEQFVDIVGTFTKGPEYGIFELTIDGQPLKMGVNVELEIFKDVRGFRGTRRVRSAVSAEITPRNTGR